MDTTQVLADEVRATVRERQIDPRANTDAVRQVATEIVEAHERRSLTGAVRALDDPESTVGQLVTELVGFGPLQGFLDDPDVEEIWINEPDRVFVARAGRHELTSVILTEPAVRDLVERMLAGTGRRLDVSHPFVDAMLPGGHRLHVVLDGVARGFTSVNIRKFGIRANSLDNLVSLGSLTTAAARSTFGHGTSRSPRGLWASEFASLS